MPDALLCTLAFLTAAVVAAPRAAPRLYPALLLTAATLGMLALRILPGFPPASAADRFLCLLPVLVLADLADLVTSPRNHRLLQQLALLTIVPVVLHQSVWLTQPAAATVLGKTPNGWLLLICLAPLPPAGAWLLQQITADSRRTSAAACLPASLVCCLLSCGIVIMLGGYLKGGLLAVPLAGSMLPSALRHALGPPQSSARLPLTFCWGSLCGLLLIGLFFGRLTTVQAGCFATIPLLAVLPVLPPHPVSDCRRQTLIRTAVTVTLCGLLLLQAWSVFAVHMLPLLARHQHLSAQQLSRCHADACSATLGQTASADPPFARKSPAPPHIPAG